MPSRRSASSSATITRPRLPTAVVGGCNVAWAMARREDRRHGRGPRDLQRWSTRSPGSSRETDRPVEVYEATLRGDRPLARLGARRGLGGAPQDGRLHCVRTWHAGEGTAEFEALRRSPSRRARAFRAGWSRRSSRRGSSTCPGTRTSRARTRPVAAACTRASASRCAARGACSGSWSSSPASRTSRTTAAGDDERARQPGRAVRRPPPRRGGGASQRVAAARDARSRARRGGDDGRRRARDRLEQRRRGDLRIPGERGDRSRHGGADRAALPARAHRRGLARFLETGSRSCSTAGSS